MIPLHIPYYADSSRKCIQEFVLGRNNDDHALRASEQLRGLFKFNNVFLTKSCTHALETIALLLQLQPNDEVIVPSYTFVSTANAFALFGAKIVYADSEENHPNTSLKTIEPLITNKTKAIVVMHYASVPVQGLKQLRELCDAKGIFLIEDAAHCIGVKYENKYLGSFGHASTFSFHESKNITCIEGGLLVVNHEPWVQLTHVIVNKGTNRQLFDEKQINFYTWVGFGLNAKMDNLHAVLLNEQLKYVERVNKHRVELYSFYTKALQYLMAQNKLMFHDVSHHDHNAHIFWLLLKDKNQREALQHHMTKNNIVTTFHYQALHNSPFGKQFHDGTQRKLNNAIKFEEQLLRLPLYYQMPTEQAEKVVEVVNDFFKA